MTWQPASTAPCDGTRFLARETDGEVVATEYYKLYHDKYVLQENGLYAKETVCYHAGFNCNRFTEWHPIPKDNIEIGEDITDSNIVEHLQNFAQTGANLRCQIEEYAANRILELETSLANVKYCLKVLQDESK